MNVDRFFGAAPVVRGRQNNERMHEIVSGIGGDDPLINIVGPWTGIATPPEALGINPLTGERYYVDDLGMWQPFPAGYDGTQEVVAGPAPALGVIPVEVSSQTRDDDDFHTIQYDDYIVVYTFPDAEVRRSSVGDGGFEQITLSAPASLLPSLKAGWLREYTITATAPLATITVDGVSESVVQFTLPAPTVDGQRIDVVRNSPEKIHLDGSINGDATGGVINQDNRKIHLVADGATWKWSH